MIDAVKVKVGEQEYSIAPFRAYKALLAGRIISRVSDQISKVMDNLAEYNNDYREKHKLRITREMAEARAAEAPGYQALLDGALKTQPYVELPQAPSFEEQLLAVFSQAFEFASGELMQMIALALIPNSDLRGAWREDEVFTKLNEFGCSLFEEAEVGELVEVAVAVNEVVRAQLAPHQEALGKLKALYSRAEATKVTSNGDSAESESPPTTSSTTPSPDSSTDSPAPTDGPKSTSSSDLSGVAS